MLQLDGVLIVGVTSTCEAELGLTHTGNHRALMGCPRCAQARACKPVSEPRWHSCATPSTAAPWTCSSSCPS